MILFFKTLPTIPTNKWMLNHCITCLDKEKSKDDIDTSTNVVGTNISWEIAQAKCRLHYPLKKVKEHVHKSSMQFTLYTQALVAVRLPRCSHASQTPYTGNFVVLERKTTIMQTSTMVWKKQKSLNNNI